MRTTTPSVLRVAALLAAFGLVVAACGGSDEAAEASDTTVASTTTTEPVVPAGIGKLIDDYLRAWEERDEAAVRAAVAQRFLINEYIYEKGRPATPDRVFLKEHITDDVDGVVAVGFQYEWRNEQVGKAIFTGDGPWFVSVEEHWIEGAFRLEGMANYTIVDDDGVLKIANHYWAGLQVLTTE